MSNRREQFRSIAKRSRQWLANPERFADAAAGAGEPAALLTFEARRRVR
jgi:hypothetical protein